MRSLVLAAAALLLAPAQASQPGQPLDCSDWVILEPGITCRELQVCGYESTSGNLDFPCSGVAGSPITAEGRILSIELTEPERSCSGLSRERLELKDSNGADERVLAYVDGRCCEAPLGCRDIMLAQGRAFDATNGRLLVAFRSVCLNDPGCGYAPVEWLAAFEGFPTTFEILQTYTPTTSELSFRVPYMPEGFQYADYFDTYYGDLAMVGDWSQAQPLQCGYPSTPPSVGDYLTVADPLPDPAPGAGRYYVTAVTHQGQRRYGRKSTNGVLTGRDPTVLPICME